MQTHLRLSLIGSWWLGGVLIPGVLAGDVVAPIRGTNFSPTDYVDITAVAAQKRAACLAHRSQLDESWYAEHHDRMETFRGAESGHARAEAFVRQARSPSLPLLAKP